MGGTQTGSGCNFLRKLSEPFLVQSIQTSKGRREEGKGVSTKKGQNEAEVVNRRTLQYGLTLSGGGSRKEVEHSKNESLMYE